MKTATILKKAKAKLTVKTWRNHYPGGEGHCCVTAIDTTGGENAVALDLFREAIGQPCVSDWNDAEGRTLAEVHAAFDKAITLASRP